MKATQAKDVLHFCRKCGESFRSSLAGSAHIKAARHAEEAHGFRVATRCPAGCGLKATYHEARAGQVLYGAGAR